MEGHEPALLIKHQKTVLLFNQQMQKFFRKFIVRIMENQNILSTGKQQFLLFQNDFFLAYTKENNNNFKVNP